MLQAKKFQDFPMFENNKKPAKFSDSLTAMMKNERISKFEKDRGVKVKIENPKPQKNMMAFEDLQ